MVPTYMYTVVHVETHTHKYLEMYHSLIWLITVFLYLRRKLYNKYRTIP